MLRAGLLPNSALALVGLVPDVSFGAGLGWAMGGLSSRIGAALAGGGGGPGPPRLAAAPPLSRPAAAQTAGPRRPGPPPQGNQ